tara:strand:- start:936 stop:1379 length:444 start_codon:yes stop_codon:yes gene_type:complete
MARRKNTKRIDPRYFLHETTDRDEIEEAGAPQRFLNPQQAKKYLAKAIYYSLRDARAYTADSAMSLEGLIGGGNNSAVVRYLKEFGLDDKGIKAAMDTRSEYIRGAGASRPPTIPRPTGDDTAPSEWEVLKYAQTATGDQGVYMQKA